jgi:signal transduction histidine kinase
MTGRRLALLRAALFASIVVIAFLDWATPAGVVVGILLAVPVVLSSMGTGVDVLAAGLIAAIAFVLAAIHGAPPISPPEVWVPNRIFVFLLLPASTLVARILQQRRAQAEAARDAALSARDLNALLTALLAHDLRSPLTSASQCIRYVLAALNEGGDVDRSLLADTGARLDRSLRAIEVVLSLSRGAADGDANAAQRVRVRDDVAAEVASFRAEAEGRGKRLVVDVDGIGGAELSVNRLVLRQVIAILLDNAIRYAAPGDVTVTARKDGDRLFVRIADQGPSGASGDGLPKGAGLGLRLSRALAAHASGSLNEGRDGPGSAWELRLPCSPAPPPSAEAPHHR